VIPFRERNKTVIGGVGLVVLTAACSGRSASTPCWAATSTRPSSARRRGLAPNDEVRVAGVKVGKVLSVELDGPKVLVEFRVKDARLGPQTRADIRIKTLLGRKLLSITPEGDGELEPGSTIPLARTTAPFDITDAFRDLATTADAIDTEQLAESYTVLADTFRDTPDDVRVSLEGLSRLSATIASRDAQLGELLSRSRGVTEVLAERDEDLTAFLADSSLVLRELEARRESISLLLDSTTVLSEQLIALVRENRATLGPALAELEEVTALLQRNKANLELSIERLAPFVRVFANNLGNGRWFDTIVNNLTAPSLVPGCFGEGQQVEQASACPGEKVNERRDPRGTPEETP
jgi:phospholipid/cholesterol/gamma-HCH transport system substrate-binding protein